MFNNQLSLQPQPISEAWVMLLTPSDAVLAETREKIELARDAWQLLKQLQYGQFDVVRRVFFLHPAKSGDSFADDLPIFDAQRDFLTSIEELVYSEKAPVETVRSSWSSYAKS